MVMHLRCGQGHGASDVFNLNPGHVSRVHSLKHVLARLEFRDYAQCALLDYLRNKLVCIEQSATNSDEQTAGASATRIMADIGDHLIFVARQSAAGYFR